MSVAGLKTYDNDYGNSSDGGPADEVPNSDSDKTHPTKKVRSRKKIAAQRN